MQLHAISTSPDGSLVYLAPCKLKELVAPRKRLNTLLVAAPCLPSDSLMLDQLRRSIRVLNPTRKCHRDISYRPPLTALLPATKLTSTRCSDVNRNIIDFRPLQRGLELLWSYEVIHLASAYEQRNLRVTALVKASQHCISRHDSSVGVAHTVSVVAPKVVTSKSTFVNLARYIGSSTGTESLRLVMHLIV